MGDAGVDLYVGAVKQLKADVETLPSTWEALPEHWRAALPADADLSRIRRYFRNERFRVEHLMNVSSRAIQDIRGAGGLDEATTPDARNVVFSTEPAIVGLDGESMAILLPASQELWEIPHDGPFDVWLGEPAAPRSAHGFPFAMAVDQDIPVALNTDPPSVRDPRPAFTLIGAVARTPFERDPEHWLDQTGTTPATYPVDYLLGKAYGPWGLTAAGANPMALTMEQALGGMTFWGAYAAGWEDRLGAFALPPPGSDSPGYFADAVVWMSNPFAVKGPTGWTLEDLARIPEGVNDEARLATLNAFLQEFRPRTTLVAGVPVYVQPPGLRPPPGEALGSGPARE